MDPVGIPAAPLVTAAGGESAADWARYRWILMYAKMPRCERQCVREVERLTQVHLALGRDRDRVQRVVFAVGAEPPALGGDSAALVARSDVGHGRALADSLGIERSGAGRLFIVDPRGFVVAASPPDADRPLKDLHRWLDVSRVG